MASTIWRVACLSTCGLTLLSAWVGLSCEGKFEAPCEQGYASCGNDDNSGNGGQQGGDSGSSSGGGNSGGCETSILTDPDNCGACGIQCNDGACVDGACTTSCGSACNGCGVGLANCNGQTGCSTNILDDPSNCGGCGRSCGGASGTCLAGTCGAILPDGGVALDSGGLTEAGTICASACAGLDACDATDSSLAEACTQECNGAPSLFASCAMLPAGDCNGLSECVWQAYFRARCPKVSVRQPSGVATCGTTVTCQNTCAGDAACLCGCISLAATTVSFDLLDYDICSDVNCGTGACTQCASELSACQQN